MQILFAPDFSFEVNFIKCHCNWSDFMLYFILDTSLDGIAVREKKCLDVCNMSISGKGKVMNTTKLIVAHFSPTGGTKKVADAIATGFNMPVEELDLTKDSSSVAIDEADILLAALPVYAGRVPQVALKRLSAIRGIGQKALAVVVYGNREYDDALLETRNALEANGFQVVAAAAFIAEHSIVRSVASSRPDEEDKRVAREFATRVAEKLDVLTSVQVPGNEPYVERKPTPFHPTADETCIRCGLCAAQCPTMAISVDNPERSGSDLCINCLRCVQVCPLQCRNLPATFLAGITQMLNEKAAGYKKPSIFLSEI